MRDVGTLSVREAAAVLGLGLQAVYQAAREGRLSVLRSGRKLRVPRAVLEQILQDPARFSPGNAMDEEEVAR